MKNLGPLGPQTTAVAKSKSDEVPTPTFSEADVPNSRIVQFRGERTTVVKRYDGYIVSPLPQPNGKHGQLTLRTAEIQRPDEKHDFHTGKSRIGEQDRF